MRIPFAYSLLACSILSSSLALANQSPAQLGSTVVSASGFEQKITDAPASISVVSNADLQKKRYSNLAQALDDVEGKSYATYSNAGVANGIAYGTDYTHSTAGSTGTIEEGRRLWMSATYAF